VMLTYAEFHRVHEARIGQPDTMRTCSEILRRRNVSQQAR